MYIIKDHPVDTEYLKQTLTHITRSRMSLFMVHNMGVDELR